MFIVVRCTEKEMVFTPRFGTFFCVKFAVNYREVNVRGVSMTFRHHPLLLGLVGIEPYFKLLASDCVSIGKMGMDTRRSVLNGLYFHHGNRCAVLFRTFMGDFTRCVIKASLKASSDKKRRKEIPVEDDQKL